MTQNSFRRIENPYITGNPIKSKELFFGRQEEFASIRNNIGKTKVILLKGGRRSGKTSILKQIEAGHISEIREVAEAVFCDFHRMSQIEKDEDLPFLIGNEILAVNIFEEFRDSFINDSGSWTVKLVRLIRACLKKISPKVLILLWDEYEESLERTLESGKIDTSAAFRWFNDVRDENIYFIMTGSRHFGKSLDPIFSPISRSLDIHLLTENDTKDLIRKPVDGSLEYSDDAVQRIYRLSGGYPFFVQYICQLLVDHINLKLHRNHAEAADLNAVIEKIHQGKDTAGHIDHTWGSLSDEAKMTLAALAHTIRESDAYIEPKKVIRTAQKRGFPMREKEYNEAIRAILGSYLIERENDGRVRFKIDIFRYWIAHRFQTLEDLELKNDHNIQPPEQQYRKILLYAGAALILAIIFFAIFISWPTPQPHTDIQKGDCVQLKKGIEKPSGIDPQNVERTKSGKCEAVEKNENILEINCLPEIEKRVVRPDEWEKCK